MADGMLKFTNEGACVAMMKNHAQNFVNVIT